MECFEHVEFKISVKHSIIIVNKQLGIGVWNSGRMLVYTAIGSPQYIDYM